MMQIAKHKVVAIDYSLSTVDGRFLDTTEGKTPLCYIQGIDNFIPGVEKALEGKSKGDHLEIIIPPEEGYGKHNESLVRQVSRKTFDKLDELEPGMQFQTQIDSENMVLTIIRIDGDDVTVDGNHPLVGLTLCFDLTVTGVRNATDEEIKKGTIL